MGEDQGGNIIGGRAYQGMVGKERRESHKRCSKGFANRMESGKHRIQKDMEHCIQDMGNSQGYRNRCGKSYPKVLGEERCQDMGNGQENLHSYLGMHQSRICEHRRCPCKVFQLCQADMGKAQNAVCML